MHPGSTVMVNSQGDNGQKAVSKTRPSNNLKICLSLEVNEYELHGVQNLTFDQYFYLSCCEHNVVYGFIFYGKKLLQLLKDVPVF